MLPAKIYNFIYNSRHKYIIVLNSRMIESERSSFLGMLTQDMTEKRTCYFIHFESDWNGFADFLFLSWNISNSMDRIYLYKTNHILMLTTTVFWSPLCLFVCPIITLEPLDRFVKNFDWETLETHGNVLGLELRF